MRHFTARFAWIDPQETIRAAETLEPAGASS